jgi:hypothetical protein
LQIFREVDSVGHNVDRAHVDCLRVLADPARRLTWRYVFLLQVGLVSSQFI